MGKLTRAGSAALEENLAPLDARRKIPFDAQVWFRLAEDDDSQYVNIHTGELEPSYRFDFGPADEVFFPDDDTLGSQDTGTDWD
jgi:hypothetical protein